MQQWEDYKRIEQEALRNKLNTELESVVCPKCQSTWFEQIDAFQYRADHNLILGQDVPVRKTGMVAYKVLRCLRCSDCLEPRVIHTTMDSAGGDYNDFLDTIQGKNDKRTTVDLEAKIVLLESKVLELTKVLDDKTKKSKKETKNEVLDQR